MLGVKAVGRGYKGRRYKASGDMGANQLKCGHITRSRQNVIGSALPVATFGIKSDEDWPMSRAPLYQSTGFG